MERKRNGEALALEALAERSETAATASERAATDCRDVAQDCADAMEALHRMIERRTVRGAARYWQARVAAWFAETRRQEAERKLADAYREAERAALAACRAERQIGEAYASLDVAAMAHNETVRALETL